MNMKDLRLRVKKKPEQVAVELGVACSTVHNWDTQRTTPRMTPSKMKQLMKVYKCTFEELVKAEEEIPNE